MMASSYLNKFSVIGLHFVRRPVEEMADEGALGMVDNGHARGWTDRQMATFKGGRWVTPKGKPLRFEPKFWTVLDDEVHRSAS